MVYNFQVYIYNMIKNRQFKNVSMENVDGQQDHCAHYD